METWARFCDIIKYNQRNENLVVKVTTRFFFCEENISKIVGLNLFLVPPEIDIQSEYIIEDVSSFDSEKQTMELSLHPSLNLNEFVGKAFVVDEDKLNFAICKNIKDNNVIGKTLHDKKLGIIGKVKSVSGSIQKLLVVEMDQKEVYVPFVDDIIIEIANDKIVADLPDGLLNINEA